MNANHNEIETAYSPFVKKKINQGFLIFLCWLIYTVAQTGRYCYGANVNLIMEKYSVNHTDAGLVTTLFFICYGLGQIVNGFLCNEYNRRIVLTVVLLGSALINLSVFLGIDFVYIKYLWALNGILQSSLWVLLLLTLGIEIDKDKLAKTAFIMSIASTGGTFISYGICSLFTAFGCFEYSFLTSSVLLTVVAILWFIVSKNLQSKTEVKKDADDSDKVSDREMPKNFIWLIVMFSFFSLVSYAVSGGLKSWAPSILKEMFGLQDWLSIFLSVFLPFCSMFNAVISNFLYKKFKNFVVVCIVCFIATCILIIPTVCLLDTSWILTLIMLVILCVSSGTITNALTVQVPLYLQNKKTSSGFLAGVLNGACYVGNAISTYVLGVIADNSEWNKIFVLFFIVCFISLAICVVYYAKMRKEKI